MLGQPMPMLIPQVLGFKLHGELPEGATATDLVLTVTEMLRERGVVGKFVEFYGAGLAGLPIADRATIGNMSPEFGSTCAIFPIDAETLRYLELVGAPHRADRAGRGLCARAGSVARRGLRGAHLLGSDRAGLGEVVPSIAGPKRPQDRVSLTDAKHAFGEALRGILPEVDGEDDALGGTFPASDPVASQEPANGDGAREAALSGRGVNVAQGDALRARVGAPVALEMADGREATLDHGHVVIAAITSCTNTSNPSVMVGAGILARNALARGLQSKPWVKTSLAPGSKVVTEYLDKAGLTESLERLGFDLVGYGCTTCIGNSGPLPQEVSEAVGENDLAVVSVLSGNRNFEGRINPDVKMNYLASPPSGRGLRAGGHDGHRHRGRAARPGPGRPRRVSARHLAIRARGRRDDRGGDPLGHVPQELRRGVRRRRALELAGCARGRPLRVGARLHLRAPAALLRGDARRARAARRHRGRARAGLARRQRHDRPHLAGRLDQARRTRRGLPAGARGGPARLQLLRLAARQP